MVIPWLVLPAAAATLGGTIQGEDGQPIPEVTVYAINTALEAAQATTDEAGAYNFVGLPQGRYRIFALPPNGDDAAARYFPNEPRYCDATSMHLVDGGEPSSADLTLPLGLRLSGRLEDTSGAPVSGAIVRAHPVAPANAPTRDATTDADGRFVLAGLEPSMDGTWRVEVGVEDFPLQWLGGAYQEESATTHEAGTDIGPAVLLDGIGVSGTVWGPTGPVENALVRVVSGGQIRRGSTDASGVYTVLGLPPGDVLTWAEADALATTYLGDADRPTEVIPTPEEGAWVEGADMVLPGEATLSLVLGGGAPRTGGDYSPVSVLLYNDALTIGQGARADADGAVQIGGLWGGDYTLYVYGGAAGHAEDWVRNEDGSPVVFTLADEEISDPVELELPLSTVITGQVIDDEGLGVGHALVVLSDARNTDDVPTTFVAKTEGDGRFGLIGVPQGAWRIRTMVQPFCPDDLGFVTMYWPGDPNPDLGDALQVNLDDGAIALQIELPVDRDQDQMSDRWERRHQLDLEVNDSSEDPDGDGWPNLSEYRNGTDPNVAEGEWITVRKCGCGQIAPRSGALWWLVPLLCFRRRGGAAGRIQVPSA